MLSKKWMIAFRKEDRAQDLIEYTLLIGFVAVAAIGLFIGSGNSVSGIWATANSTIAVANGGGPSAGGGGGAQPAPREPRDGDRER